MWQYTSSSKEPVCHQVPVVHRSQAILCLYHFLQSHGWAHPWGLTACLSKQWSVSAVTYATCLCSKLPLEALPGYRPTFLCCEGLPFVARGENWLMHHLIHGLHWKTCAPGQAILIGVKKWQTPAEMLEKIHEKLAPRVHARKEVLVSNMINGVHDWTAWLQPMGVDTPSAEKWMLHFLCDLWLEFFQMLKLDKSCAKNWH